MTRHIIDVTIENFQTEVIEASHTTPVLADFWAPWCGPCQSLLPVVTRLAGEYGGKFILAKINVDDNRELALQFNARSVPTVKLFKNGEVVDEFMGAQPESAVRELLNRHIASEADKMLARARHLITGGESKKALETLQNANKADPHNVNVRNALLSLMLDLGQLKEVEEAIGIIKDKDDEVKAIEAKLNSIKLLADAPAAAELEEKLRTNPDDAQTVLQLAAYAIADGEQTRAADYLLSLVPTGGETAAQAKEQLLELIRQMPDPEVCNAYRRKLANLLY